MCSEGSGGAGGTNGGGVQAALPTAGEAVGRVTTAAGAVTATTPLEGGGGGGSNYTGGPTTTTQLLNAAFGVLSLVVKSTVIWRIAQLILQAFVKDDLNGLHGPQPSSALPVT